MLHKEAPLVVHLVHGTWPYGCRSRKRWEKLRQSDPKRYPKPWFMEGSSFCEDLRRQTKRPLDFRPFRWSGKSSFKARREAARCFKLAYQKALASSPPGSQHVVIAHSHGGTVALDALSEESMPLDDGALEASMEATRAAIRALSSEVAAAGGDSRYQSKPAPQIAGLVTMGTPFAALREFEANLGERAILAGSSRWMLALLACAGLAFLLARWMGSAGTFIAAFIVLVLLAAFISAAWLIRVPEGLSDLLAPRRRRLACALKAFRTPGDEASLAIAAAQLVNWLLTRSLWLLGLFLGQWLNDGVAGALRPVPKALRLPVLAIGPTVLLALGLLAFDSVATDGTRPTLTYFVLAASWLPLLVAVLVALLLVLIPAAAFFGTLWLRCSTGGAALRYSGFATVEVEVLPSGIPAQLEVLEVPPEESRITALSHSLHQLPVTRARISEFLDQV